MSISNMKLTIRTLVAAIIVAPLLLAAFPPVNAQAISGSDFTAGRIIDDPIFFDPNRMATGDIQNFLNSKVPACDSWGTQMRGSVTRRQYAESNGVSVPFTCLRDYRQDIPTKSADQFCQTIGVATNRSAAEIIKIVSDACNISPMAMIVLLQKEQSLITDDWPWPIQYRAATGYGCPDTADCDTQYYGFFNQVYYAARQFQRYVQQPQLFGYRSGRSNYVQYNPNAGCSGTGVVIQNGPTAALYNYTPYQPNAAALSNLYGTGDGCSAYGNRNFWRIYNDWFGPTVNDVCSYNPPGQYLTTVDFRKLRKNLDWGTVTVYSGAGTDCIESHTWNQGFSSWNRHTASNFPTINPADGVVKYADLDGDGIDEPVLVGLDHTGSGKVEFHVWSNDMKKWVVHAASNLPTATLTDLAIDFADLNGDGRDEPVVFGYKNTGSGMVEFHVWNDGLQSWKMHWTSNLPVIDPANMNIGFADLNGDGRDEGVAIGVGGTGTGNIELHVWDNDFANWRGHYATSMPLITNGDGGVNFADVDGDGKDEGVVVMRRNTGSGRVEFHVWNPGFNTWKGHWASNLNTFQ